MKTMFQMGFPNHTSFWMGQAVGSHLDVATLLSQLSNADNQQAAISAFMAQPNYQTILGTDAAQFASLLAGNNAVINDITTLEQMLNSNATDSITTGQVQEMNTYITNSNALYNMVQAHSGAAATATAAAQAASGVAAGVIAANAAKAAAAKPATPAKPAVAPAPAAAGPNPLLIGGVAAAGLAVLAFALKK